MRTQNIKTKEFNSIEVDRIIEMAWEDRTPFEAICFQFNLKEKDVVQLMRSNLKLSSFKMWRKRVSGRKSKHGFPNYKTRFKSANQKWKSNWQKIVRFVSETSSGERNGIKIGIMSYIAQKDVEEEKNKNNCIEHSFALKKNFSYFN